MNLLTYDCCNTYSNGEMSCIDKKSWKRLKNSHADDIANVIATQIKYTNDRKII